MTGLLVTVLVVSPMLAESVTSTRVMPLPEALVQTTAGAPVVVADGAGEEAIGELRRLSGLTWEQLAELFGVSRRALHFWASGRPMASHNAEHLRRSLAVVRMLDRGSAAENRALLLGYANNGVRAAEMLANGEYEQVIELLGPGRGHRVAPPKLSAAARATRAPRPPAELVDARQDSIRSEVGAARAAKSVKVRSGR